MTELKLIAAMNPQRVIGMQGQLPWHVPEDFNYFKRITSCKTILMGRKTFDSLGGLLPNRRHLVITRDRGFHHADVSSYYSVNEALRANQHEQEIYIIGGGEIYKQTLPLAHYLYLTVIDINVAMGDTFFPPIDFAEWKVEKYKKIITKKNITCEFFEYKRLINKD
jgi:dihydrofolate reductase